MENTTAYLQKEIDGVETKMKEAKDILFQELELVLFEDNDIVSGCRVIENRKIEKAIREVEEEYNEEEEEEDEEMSQTEGTEDYGHVDEDGTMN